MVSSSFLDNAGLILKNILAGRHEDEKSFKDGETKEARIPVPNFAGILRFRSLNSKLQDMQTLNLEDCFGS